MCFFGLSVIFAKALPWDEAHVHTNHEHTGYKKDARPIRSSNLSGCMWLQDIKILTWNLNYFDTLTIFTPAVKLMFFNINFTNTVTH